MDLELVCHIYSRESTKINLFCICVRYLFIVCVCPKNMSSFNSLFLVGLFPYEKSYHQLF